RRERGPVYILPWPGWDMPLFAPAEASAATGAFMLEGMRLALGYAHNRQIDAVCFAPLNRTALRAAGLEEDEVDWCAGVLEHNGKRGELYVLDKLWTLCLTPRVPLSSVAGLLTAEKVAEAITLLGEALYRAGRLTPRIGVCSFNPHVGEDGKFGLEESEII